MSVSKLKVGVAAAMVFLLGAVTGAAIWHVFSARAALDMFDAAEDGKRHGVFVWSMERKLDLSAEQKAKIEVILADYDRETDAIRPPVDPRLLAMKADMRSAIRATLRPEQQARFDTLIVELDRARGRSAPTVAEPTASAR